MGALELLLQRNRSAGKPFAASSWAKICVVTCDDPSLTGQLETALGLGPGDAVVVRLPAGGGGLSLEVVERAVAKAVYVHGCDEVLVLSHSACSLYELPAAKLIDALAKNRVPRSAVPMDLRELVGAGRDPREAVRMTVDALRRCAFLPESLLVHLGHLEEQTGELMIVEDGEKYRSERSTPSQQAQISGYVSGPSELREVAPAQVLPKLPGFEVETLNAPSIPEVKPFELQTISVQLPVATAMVLNSDPLVAGAAHTAQSLMGGDSTAEMFSPTLTSAALFGDTEGNRARSEAKRSSAPKPALKARAKPKSSAQRPSGEQLPPLTPALVEAVQKIRIFMGNEVSKPDRREVVERLAEAMQRGADSEELVKLALKPVLQSGQNRYKVIDEMILVKEEVLRLSPNQAASLLRSMVP